MEVDIPSKPKIKSEFYAHSQVNGFPPAHQQNVNYDGFSIMPEDEKIRYPAKDAPNSEGIIIDRIKDTEYKMINDLAFQLGPPDPNLKGQSKIVYRK